MDNQYDLDDVGLYGQLDPSGMTEAIESTPKQYRDAEHIARELQAAYPRDGIGEIVILGMGGSAIGGDVIKALLENALAMPVTVHRGYCPCRYYSPRTLVFAVSYSGNTEETLASLDEAVYRNCKIVAVTSGGVLLQKARGYQWPTIVVPEGLQPRAAIPYLMLPLAVTLEKMGLVQDFSRVMGQAVTSLEKRVGQWGRLQPLSDNYAKQLAQRLHGKVPVIYGMEGALAVAAYRWKCQINENSKVPAFQHVIPEMNHNEIVGWETLDDFSKRIEIIFLLDEEENPRLVHRAKITSELIKDQVGGISVIHVSGASRTEKLLSTILLGDFVSLYLALLNGRDPTPVERIGQLKARMAEVKDAPACFGNRPAPEAGPWTSRIPAGEGWRGKPPPPCASGCRRREWRRPPGRSSWEAGCRNPPVSTPDPPSSRGISRKYLICRAHRCPDIGEASRWGPSKERASCCSAGASITTNVSTSTP